MYDELFGKEDYWHLNLVPFILPQIDSDVIYFHDMTQKGYYPGELKDGVPIFYLNGQYPVFFHITTFNYALGLLNRKRNGENVDQDIEQIIEWAEKNQGIDGAWRYNFPDRANHPLKTNRASGMTQGLGISFLIRCYRLGYIERERCRLIVEKAIEMMLSDEIVSNFKLKNGNLRIIEEFYSPGNSILNGAIFALYGLYDYSIEFGNPKLFKLFIDDLKLLLPKYSFCLWSYYDLKGTINSKFYHQLHIHMMDVLYCLTKDNLFLKYRNLWRKGLSFSFIFILIKSFQKLKHINSMPMNFVKKI